MTEQYICPKCDRKTLVAEFPDQYEVWLKCPSCNFFMGMSNEDWHRIHNSPNISEKIRKMANKA
jgi:DNA-directed RNA polymerase subunit RPC12/RpoP